MYIGLQKFKRDFNRDLSEFKDFTVKIKGQD